MNVRTHLVPGLGRRRLARLSASDVRAFLHAKREAGLSQATVRQLHGILRSALSHAVREDLVPRNVAKLVQVSAGPRYWVRPLDVDEARQLLDTARADRLYALWAVALGVGPRRGEALAALGGHRPRRRHAARPANLAAHAGRAGVRPAQERAIPPGRFRCRQFARPG
jgi:integrase